MMDTTIIKFHFNAAAPNLNLKMRCMSKKQNKKIMGNNAGYILMLSEN